MKIMYVRVLFPLALQETYTYLVPEALENSVCPGRQVTAVVGKSTSTGFITQTGFFDRDEPMPVHPLRYIDAVETSRPQLSPGILSFWEWIASYYLCPQGTVAGFAMPSWRFRRQSKAGPVPDDSVSATDPGKPIVIEGVNRIDEYVRMIRKTLAQNRQCLVICPDMAGCDQLHARLSEVLRDHRVYCHHSRRSRKEQNDAARQLYAGNPCVITGMHRVLFLPYKNPGLIIVDNEQSPLHKKTDALPYIHSRDASLVLGKIFNARVVLGTVVPSLETEYNILKEKFIRINVWKKAGQPIIPFVIDTTRSEKRKEMEGLYDRSVAGAIKNVIDLGKKVLIVNASWEQTSTMDPHPQIISCTPLQLINGLSENPSLICFLNTELLLAGKLFRAHEQASQFLKTAIRWAGEQTVPVPVFVQSQDVSDPFYQALTLCFPPSYVHLLLNERSTFGYPPFSRLIVLTFSHRQRSVAERSALSMLSHIERTIPGISVYGPYSATGSRNMLFSYGIQLTVPKSEKIAPVKERLYGIIRQSSFLPAQCKVDVDPA